MNVVNLKEPVITGAVWVYVTDCPRLTVRFPHGQRPGDVQSLTAETLPLEHSLKLLGVELSRRSRKLL